MANTEMVRSLAMLSVCMYGCAAVNTPCKPYPSLDYKGVVMQCSGMGVRRVPTMLRGSLQKLLLTGTAISSLDRNSFKGRNLQDLTTLSITEGDLRNVGAEAFCSLPALTMIYLDHNQLDLLHELSFSCNKFLRAVSLVGNHRLRHLGRLVSSSVESLYLDDCSLERMDVTTVELMTALKVLSVNGNPDLHCPSVKSQFTQARPDLLVICDESGTDPTDSNFPDNREHTSEYSVSKPPFSINNTKLNTVGSEENMLKKSLNVSDILETDDGSGTDTTDSSFPDNQEHTSENSVSKPPFSINNTKLNTIGSEENMLKKSLNVSDILETDDGSGTDTTNSSFSDNEEHTSENSVSKPPFSINNTKLNAIGSEESMLKKLLNVSNILQTAVIDSVLVINALYISIIIIILIIVIYVIVNIVIISKKNSYYQLTIDLGN